MLKAVWEWYADLYRDGDIWSAIFNVLITVGIVSLIVYYVALPKTQDYWIVGGSVLVFDDSEYVKNYALPVTKGMATKTTRFFWAPPTYEYHVETAEWPNGGSLDFLSCDIPEGERVECVADDTYVYVEAHNLELEKVDRS